MGHMGVERFEGGDEWGLGAVVFDVLVALI